MITSRDPARLASHTRLTPLRSLQYKLHQDEVIE